MHLIQRDWIKWSSPHVRGSTVGQSHTCQSASLLNSPQTGTFHYLSTFLHIHSIGLHRGEGVVDRGGAGIEKTWDDRGRTRN